MNKYPTWKYVLLAVITFIGFLYAVPNLYFDDPAVQISSNSKQAPLDEVFIQRVKTVLNESHLQYKRVELQPAALLIRFYSGNVQMKARDVLENMLVPADSRAENHYTVALNLASSTPAWLSWINAKPMKLGLDLRGGVHLLLEVDMARVIDRRIQNMAKSIVRDFREQGIRYSSMIVDKKGQINWQFSDETMENRARTLLQNRYNALQINASVVGSRPAINAEFSPAELTTIRQYTIDQTMTTLRNRVNELGVAEAMVQQQGANRVAVDLPGIQDTARAKQILGGTATLAFYLVDTEHDGHAITAGMTPMGTRLYDYNGVPILLKTHMVLAGDAIVSATSALDDNGMPAVHVSIGGGSENYFSQVTRDNIGKPLGIVYIETKTKIREVDGKPIKVRYKTERLISAPRINSALGNNFQITGLDANEARDLSLLLRAGSLPAAIDIVEESTVGPSLGMENIKRGLHSLAFGMGLIIIFMVVYYRQFGLIADVALVLNLILLTAVLSMLGATLTLSGIAGIVLTVGMAVDSNVLIFERIREELRNGMSPQASIYAGYERAFSTIIDANLTTLIVAVVLFSIGSGAIRAFAITLTVGLLTSMLTGITFTRAIVNYVYGNRVLKRLSIGI